MAEERPERPQFGEYAPEGWEWKPEETPDAQNAGVGALARSPHGVGQVPGVPHNLGARPRAGGAPASAPVSPGRAPGSGTQAPGEPDSGGPAPYRADSPVATRAASPSGASRPRLADRIITITLLVIGAFGALNLAASTSGLKASFELMAAALDVDGFSAPASFTTLGMVGAVVIFAVYAVNVVYSIQRMRRGRLAFWVPLVAFALAFIVSLVIMFIALSQVPELMQAFADPDASSKMLDYLFSQTNTAP